MSVKPASAEKSAFNKLFEQGGEHNVRNMICDFAGQRELLHVSKAFRRTNQNTMVDVGRTLSMSHPAQVRKIEHLRHREIPDDERPAAEILPEIFQEVKTWMNDLEPHLGVRDQGKIAHFRRGWGRVEEIHNRWQAAPDGGEKETHINQLLIGLHRTRLLLAAVREHVAAAQAAQREAAQQGVAQRGAAQPLLDAENDGPWKNLVEHLRSIVAEENVSRRFQEVVARRNAQNPEEIFSCLSELSQNQKVHMHQRQRVEFAQYEKAHPGAFSPEYFKRAEIGVFRADLENDSSLVGLWNVIRWIINAGPAHNAPVAEIRAWLNNPANAGALGQVHELGVGGLWYLPPEIQRLQNLERLRCLGNPALGRLDELPVEIANLPLLREVTLENNSFREIPPVLQRLPAFSWLSMHRNNQPIRVLPEWLDERINSGFVRNLWLTLATEYGQAVRLDRFLGLRIFRPENSIVADEFIRLRNEQHAGLPPEEFTDVPFNLWFRENVFIPNLLFYAAAGFLEFGYQLTNIPDLYQQGWLEMARGLLMPFLPLAISLTLAFAVGLASVLLPLPIGFAIEACFFISIFSFVFNPILHNVICPIVEKIIKAAEEMDEVDDMDIPEIPEAPNAQPVAAQA